MSETVDHEHPDDEALITEIAERAQAAKLEVVRRLGPHSRLVIRHPHDRARRPLTLGIERAKMIRQYQFESWIVLDDLDVIYDAKERLLEATLQHISRNSRASILDILHHHVMHQDIALNNENESEDGDAEIADLEADESDLKQTEKPLVARVTLPGKDRLYPAELSPGSDRIFCAPGFVLFSPRRRESPPITIKIYEVDAADSDQVRKLIESLTDPLFLEIDLICNVAVRISRRRSPTTDRRRLANIDTVSLGDLPKRKYSAEASSLYFYARSADEMPLLQFLAYYQVAEFFFPKYWQIKLVQRVQNILINPTFSSDREEDVLRLIRMIGKTGRRVGSEEEALTQVIESCCGDDDLLEFLEESPEREQFFEKSKAIKGVENINKKNKNAALHSQVAKRIYSLRCRVVHSKEDGDEDKIEPLLPFSDEVNRLSFDIDLIEFVARRVLVATSSPQFR
ncbi:hypothetical protein [Amycolatopsis thermoflava]|uniref:Uncharacterized protein n=1 Tax=Amycolatopsis thermoflava TaxID=84480 RepID=A0A3N2H356_9PSEU|nr:hypothetical protein [Amycolatopsis thermoflava]ROS43334.1 hypothetical protein EDD35_5742 [Amycolatopsis thermoflava]